MTSSKKQNHLSKNNLPINNNHRSKIIDILEDNLNEIIDIRDATFYEDTKQATDMKIEIKGTDIAVRQREGNYDFVDIYNRTNRNPDVTIRSRANGHKTELDKIRNGYGDYYLYAWTKMKDWIFYDINKLRKYNVLDKDNKLQEIDNHDGTKFITLPIEKLYDINAIIDYSHNVNVFLDYDVR